MGFVILAISFLFACNSTDTKDAEAGNSTPSTDTIVEVTGLSVAQSYWTLYEESAGTCYFLPRPDRPVAVVEECQLATDASELLKKYEICSQNPDPDKINKILCDEAKSISLFLHSKLVFTKDGPYLSEDQKSEVCKIEICSSSELMNDYCSYYSERSEAAKRGDPVTAIARVDSEDERVKAAECATIYFGTGS